MVSVGNGIASAFTEEEKGDQCITVVCYEPNQMRGHDLQFGTFDAMMRSVPRYFRLYTYVARVVIFGICVPVSVAGAVPIQTPPPACLTSSAVHRGESSTAAEGV